MNLQMAEEIYCLFGETTTVTIMDWAMKFLQLKYREKQSDWYGKRDLSLHSFIVA